MISLERAPGIGGELVEVKILWDRTVLHVAHLTPPRSFHVGEEEGEGPCDYVLPSSCGALSR